MSKQKSDNKQSNELEEGEISNENLKSLKKNKNVNINLIKPKIN